MKRRLFLLGILPKLFLGCAGPIVTYYADGPHDLNVMKKKIESNNWKILDVKYDEASRFYILKVRR